MAVLTGTGLYLTLGKRVTLEVDGRAERVGTFSLSVGQLLDRRGIPVGPRDVVSPARGTGLVDGLTVQVRHAKLVTVVLAGRSKSVWSTGLTVGDVLRETGLAGYGRDARPGPTAPLRGGDVITLCRSVPVRLVVGGGLGGSSPTPRPSGRSSPARGSSWTATTG